MAHALRYLIEFCRARSPNPAVSKTKASKKAGFGDPALPYLALALALLVACVSLAPALAAQSSSSAALPVRFTVFAAKPIQDLGFAPTPRAAVGKIVFYPTARSPRYEFRGAMPVRFVDAATGSVVAEATIPPEIRTALLLFAPIEPASPNGLRYRISVLDDSEARQGRGGLAVINFSGLELAGAFGTQNVALHAGLNPTLPIGRATKVILRTTAKGRSYQAYADTVELAANQRALLILFPPFYKGSLEVQSRLLIDEPPRAMRTSK